MSKRASKFAAIFIACLSILIGTVAQAAAPLVVFNSPGPGLNAPWTDNGNVVTYGKHIFGPAGYTWDTWSGYATAELALARYAPSLANQNNTTTAMPINQDWGISLTYGLNTSGDTSDAVFAVKASDSTPQEAGIFALGRRGDDFVNVQLGTAGGGWTVPVSVDMRTDHWKDFMLHYKAATQRFDLYVDDVLTVADFDMQHGNYALDFVQIQPSRAAFVDFYRQIRIGQVHQPVSRPAGFGKQWVREHPLTLMALTLRDSLFDANEYTGAGLNTTLAWETQPATLQRSSSAGVPWIKRLPALDGASPQFQATVNSLVNSYPGGVGFLVNDEPFTTEEMLATADALDWLKQNYPSLLAFSNLGGAPDFAAHVDNYINIVRPDLLMFDYYPFSYPGVEDPQDLVTYKQRMAIIRDKGLQAGIPYWSFVQSYENVFNPYLSESDLRMEVFLTLTHGFTGVAYFTYDPANSDGDARGLLDLNGAPNHIYQSADQTDAEAARLGKVLRMLGSVDLGYVSTDPLPAGLAQWDPSDGPYITAVSAQNLSTLNGGAAEDLVVGYFLPTLGGPHGDDDELFMITNLLRAHGGSAAQARQRIHVNFDFGDSGIDSLLRVNRLTGEPERVPLVHDGGSLYHLDFILDGGTGDLFKFDTGDFPGIPGGDADLDGDVDLADLGVLATNYGLAIGGRWSLGDFDLDGDIDLADLGKLATNYGLGEAQALADFRSLSNVPEPQPMAVGMFSSIVLITWLSRQRSETCIC